MQGTDSPLPARKRLLIKHDFQQRQWLQTACSVEKLVYLVNLTNLDQPGQPSPLILLHIDFTGMPKVSGKGVFQ